MPTAPSSTVTVPPFASTLPPGLLDGLNDRDKHLYESISAMREGIEWSARLSANTANRMEEVYAQAVKTNGRLLEAESAIKTIKVDAEEHEAATAPVVRAYGFGLAAIRSKFFWLGFAGLVFFALPWAISNAPTPTEFMRAVFGL